MNAIVFLDGSLGDCFVQFTEKSMEKETKLIKYLR